MFPSPWLNVAFKDDSICSILPLPLSGPGLRQNRMAWGSWVCVCNTYSINAEIQTLEIFTQKAELVGIQSKSNQSEI